MTYTSDGTRLDRPAGRQEVALAAWALILIVLVLGVVCSAMAPEPPPAPPEQVRTVIDTGCGPEWPF